MTFLPGQDSFGSRFTKSFAPRFEDAFSTATKAYNSRKEKEQESKGEEELLKTKHGFDLERDKQKILEKEAAQQRANTEFAQLLGISPQSNQALAEKEPGNAAFAQEQGLSSSVNPSTQERQAPLSPTAGKQFSWENLDDNQKAMFAFKYPQVAKQLQSEHEHKQNADLKAKTAENKEITESFKENQPYIDKTYDQYEDALRRDAILDEMIQIDERGELSPPGIINLFEQLGFNQEWLQNPENDVYTKLGLDLLGGGTLQADYGSRVLQSEFKVSQQRIPTLMQTKEGRRQIAENIKAMLLPSKLKQERLQYYLDQQDQTGKPLPHNIRGKILKDIKPQLEESYDKFKQRNGRYQVKKGTFPEDNALEKYYYLSNGNEKEAIRMMKEDGYDTDF